MGYGAVHRFLLRSIASRGVMSLEESQEHINKFAEDQKSTYSVKEMVKDINQEIRPFKQQIKVTNDEMTNEEVLVFVSLGFDDATKSQNVFSATELEYFRILIEQIMTTITRQITGINALNLVGNMNTTFTKTDAQKLLDLWCRMRYLDKEDNNYALGVRAIHEFEGYLRENMPDTIEECCLCKQIVFRYPESKVTKLNIQLQNDKNSFWHNGLITVFNGHNSIFKFIGWGKDSFGVHSFTSGKSQGVNCPGCSIAIHTRCLNKYLEKVTKWPCCKIDFSQEQLDRLNREDSCRVMQRRTPAEQADRMETSHASEENTSMESTQQDAEANQIIPEISQRVTKNRKRGRQQPSQGDVEEMEASQDIPESSQRTTRKRKRC